MGNRCACCMIWGGVRFHFSVVYVLHLEIALYLIEEQIGKQEEVCTCDEQSVYVDDLFCWKRSSSKMGCEVCLSEW